jgi:hypothetical protein
MANDKLNAFFELHHLCNCIAFSVQDPYYALQLELLGMQENSSELMLALIKFHDVVQLHTELLTSEVH